MAKIEVFGYKIALEFHRVSSTGSTSMTAAASPTSNDRTARAVAPKQSPTNALEENSQTRIRRETLEAQQELEKLVNLRGNPLQRLFHFVFG